LAEDIRWRASALVDADRHVGARVTEAVGCVGDLTSEEHDEPGTTGTEEHASNGVQLVDFATPKQWPIPEPGVPDDPVSAGRGPSAAGIRSVLEKLPSRNHVGHQ